jgi:sulfur carrier protein ThiS
MSVLKSHLELDENITYCASLEVNGLHREVFAVRVGEQLVHWQNPILEPPIAVLPISEIYENSVMSRLRFAKAQ